MSITLVFIVTLVLLIAVFDVWVIYKKGKQESISAYLIRGSREYPLIVFLCGIVAGHVLWSMKTEDIYYNTKCIETKEK